MEETMRKILELTAANTSQEELRGSRQSQLNLTMLAAKIAAHWSGVARPKTRTGYWTSNFDQVTVKLYGSIATARYGDQVTVDFDTFQKLVNEVFGKITGSVAPPSVSGWKAFHRRLEQAQVDRPATRVVSVPASSLIGGTYGANRTF